MKRQSLKHMTPEQRAERKRIQAAERQKRKRERDKPAIDMARAAKELERMIEKDLMERTEWPIAPMTEELSEFIDELITLPLDVASLALAEYEHQNRFRVAQYTVERGRFFSGDSPDDIRKKENRWRRFGLISLFSIDAMQRLNQREANKRHKVKEETEAKALGMTVERYQEHKRFKRRQEKLAAKRAAA